ncbi:hypothetical protein [Halioglobus sp. HI00S01]|uniref:hypothetical protein n=1 Tax=Halioglobus sp. HI00S01 TaxID=1822214 RepID=UPI001E286511|nr:hypothetical protein [Halioglobus sp. HI00S01]
MDKSPSVALDLDQDVIADIVRSIEADYVVNEKLTDTGAVAMDTALAAHLNGAPRRVAATQDAKSGDSTYMGGAWVDQVRMGDRCFRVVRPIQSIRWVMRLGTAWHASSCNHSPGYECALNNVIMLNKRSTTVSLLGSLR